MNLLLSYSEVYAAKLKASGHERLGDAKDADGRDVQVFRVREANIPKAVVEAVKHLKLTPTLGALIGTLNETEWWDLAEALSKHLDGLNGYAWAAEMREACLRWWAWDKSASTRALHLVFQQMSDEQWAELSQEIRKASGMVQ